MELVTVQNCNVRPVAVFKPPLVSGLVAVGVMFKRGGYLVQVHLAMVTTVMTMVTLVVAGFTRGVAELQASASANVLRSTLATTSAAKKYAM